MKFITVSELRAQATQIVSEMEATKEEVVVTKNGKPVVLMQLVGDEAFTLKRKEVGYNGNGLSQR
ncbi:MAG: type II toxin-antitoxin system Phd/YefM family antitoxin [Syntrophorhabdales bacterium]|jgi:antitoxin (DNA-binding transcriptional repressor) of toxin-antitoxin stability system